MLSVNLLTAAHWLRQQSTAPLSDADVQRLILSLETYAADARALELAALPLDHQVPTRIGGNVVDLAAARCRSAAPKDCA